MKSDLTIKEWLKKMKIILKKHTIQATVSDEEIDLDELDKQISKKRKAL